MSPSNEDIPSPNWREYALCKGTETNLFFPYNVTRANLIEVRKTIQVCEQCPVQAECLYEALHYDHDGIWGGTTLRQREKEFPTSASRKSVTLSQCKKVVSEKSYGDSIPYTKRFSMYED